MLNNTVNVHPIERVVSITFGGALLWQGIRRQTPKEIALATPLLYRGVSGQSFLYKALHINTAGSGAREDGAGDKASEQRSITIRKSADELYRIWQEPSNLAMIMGDSAEITPLGNKSFRWRVQGPLGKTIEWETKIVEEHAGKLIRWHTPEGAKLASEGVISFQQAPKDWGTEVTLQIMFKPIGGNLGKKISMKAGMLPRLFLEKILRRYKSLVETGEIASLKGTPSGRDSEKAFAV